MNATELRPKRQITLPAEVCKAGGLSVNDKLEWAFEGGCVVGRRLERKESPLVEPVKRGGRLMLPMKLDRASISKALRADRDA